jgi:hypothetical protein
MKKVIFALSLFGSMLTASAQEKTVETVKTEAKEKLPNSETIAPDVDAKMKGEAPKTDDQPKSPGTMVEEKKSKLKKEKEKIVPTN